jgi:hypothetical protein
VLSEPSHKLAAVTVMAPNPPPEAKPHRCNDRVEDVVEVRTLSTAAPYTNIYLPVPRRLRRSGRPRYTARACHTHTCAHVYTAAARRGPPLMSANASGAQALFTFSPSNVSLAWGVMWRCMQSEPGYAPTRSAFQPSWRRGRGSSIPLHGARATVQQLHASASLPAATNFHSLAITGGVPSSLPQAGLSQTLTTAGRLRRTHRNEPTDPYRFHTPQTRAPRKTDKF